MGKYNLGMSSSEVANFFDKKNLYVDNKKAKVMVDDVVKQLDIINSSLSKVSALLFESVSLKYVKCSRATAFTGWARKAKSQAAASLKLSNNVHTKLEDDIRDYPIKLLDDRIAELERKIASLTK